MILFFLSLIFIIIYHELGHLITAKLCKCGVDIFSIGFGKALFKKKIDKTIYQICLILLGGYCKLKGELSYSRSRYAFTNLRYNKKLMIAMVGCFVNIILGILCILLSFKIHYFLFYFGVLSILLGASNLLPLPSLDGSYPFLFIFEKFFPKKKVYSVGNKIFNVFFKILLISNFIVLPWFLLRGIKMLNETIEVLWHCYKLGVF